MSKETLVVIVGAGASIAAAIPDTAALTQASKAALPSVLSGIGCGFGGVMPSPPRLIPLATILDGALKADYGADYDFELMLNVLEELEAFLAMRHPSTVPGAVNLPTLPVFAELRHRFSCINDSWLMNAANSAILTEIHRTVGNACLAAPSAQALRARVQLERIFQALDARFRLVVVNFNYDDIIDCMSLNLRDGYVDRVSGQPCSLFSPDEWNKDVQDDSALLMHLHGSVRYGYRPSSSLTATSRFAEPAKYDSIKDAQSSLSGRGVGGTLVNGRAEDASFIVSGLAKAARLSYNARPYGYYYKAAMDFLSQTDRLLVLGYGWRDTHINTWVREYADLRPTRRTAVVTLRPAAIAGHNTLEHQELLRLGEPVWSKIATSAFARTPTEIAAGAPSRFHQLGKFAVAPEGFLMDAADEQTLLDFMV